jgi:ADP-ribose pyrophosphatase YjhB (NUDIX family)
MMKNYQDMLIKVLDEIRAIGKNGLHFTQNPHDQQRYQRLLEIATINLSQLTELNQQKIAESFSQEIGYITPKLGVDAAIFDDKGRILLLRRSDDDKWSLPCGWVEVGESPLTAIIREVKEETGLDVKPTHILGIYNAEACAPHRPHNCCHILYLCTRLDGDLSISSESKDIGYYNINDVTPWHEEHNKVAKDALNFLQNQTPFSAIKLEI